MGRCIGSGVLCLSPVTQSTVTTKYLYKFSDNIFHLQQLKDVKLKSETNCAKIFNKFIWYLSQARNVLIVIITSCVAYQWIVGTAPFKLSGTTGYTRNAKNTDRGSLIRALSLQERLNLESQAFLCHRSNSNTIIKRSGLFKCARN